MPSNVAHPSAAELAWADEHPHARFHFGPVDTRQCPEFNHWPFGLEQRNTGYTRGMDSAQLVRQLTERPMNYLLGQIDVLPVAGFDSSCAAMLQGATRRARGEAFVTFVQQRLHAQHDLRIVPDCGHNARCIFTADEVLPLLFPPVAKP